MKTFKEKLAEEVASAVATNTTAGVASLDSSDPTNPPMFKKPKATIIKKILKRRVPND
jgi:hypothetical protein